MFSAAASRAGCQLAHAASSGCQQRAALPGLERMAPRRRPLPGRILSETLPCANRPTSQGLRVALAKRAGVAAAGKDRTGVNQSSAGVNAAEEKEVEAEGAESSGPPAGALVGGGALLLLLATAAYLLPGGPSDWVQWAEGRIEEAGPLAPAYFAAAYIASTLLFLPGSLFTLASGYLFGPLLGTAVVSASSTSSAALAFLISRYGARPLVEEQLAKYEKFKRVDAAIAREGWKVVGLMRLSPLFPFSLSNYAFGLTGVGFWPYVGASWAGMLPPTFAYVYLGGAGRVVQEAVAGGGDAGTAVSPLQLSLYAVGAVATLLVTRQVSQLAATALQEPDSQASQNDDSKSS